MSDFKGRYISKGERSITKEGMQSCSTQLLPKNTILFSSRAPIGYVAIAENEMCTNQGFKSIIPNDKVDYLFLYYLLKYNKDKIEAMGSGTTFKEVSGNTMRNIEVVIPEQIEIQRKISSILDSIDSKIENNNKINNNLLEQASLLFQEICVDGESSDWTEGILGDIADITSGKRPPMRSDNMTDEAKIPLVGAASIMGYTNEVNHTDKILVTGRVGTHGVVQRFNYPCWTSDNTLVITSPHYEFVYQILRRVDYKAMNRGSTQPLITQGDLKKVAILIPDTKTLQKFESLVGTLMNQYEANIFENEKLAETRDVLLPILMSGELDVSALKI